MPDPVPFPSVSSWLAQFPAHQQGVIRSGFAAVRVPGQSPDALLHRASETIARHLDWEPARDTEALGRAVLLALVHQRAQARQFAATFLEGQESPEAASCRLSSGAPHARENSESPPS